MQLTPQKLSAARKNLPGAPGAGFFFISHIIQLTPQKLSAEPRNSASAEALAVARTKRDIEGEFVCKLVHQSTTRA